MNVFALKKEVLTLKVEVSGIREEDITLKVEGSNIVAWTEDLVLFLEVLSSLAQDIVADEIRIEALYPFLSFTYYYLRTIIYLI